MFQLNPRRFALISPSKKKQGEKKRKTILGRSPELQLSLPVRPEQIPQSDGPVMLLISLRPGSLRQPLAAVESCGPYPTLLRGGFF